MTDGLHGFVAQAGGAQFTRRRTDQFVDAAEAFQKPGQARAPQAGSANCNKPVILFRDRNPRKDAGCLCTTAALHSLIRMLQDIEFLHHP